MTQLHCIRRWWLQLGFLVLVVALFACGGANRRTGRLIVNTSPGGAHVSWDGQPVDGVTPMSRENLAPGRHLLTLQKIGYDDWHQTVEIAVGKVSRVDVELDQLRGIVLLETNPPGVEVRMESHEEPSARVFMGATPLLLADVPFGSTVLSLRKDGFDPVEISVKVESRVPQLRSVEMTTRLATLKVDSVPQGATVLLDGEPVGQTPCTLSAVLEGKRELLVHKSGFDAYRESLQVAPRTEITRNIALAESPASLDLDSEPSGADVFLDGKLVGKTPLKLGGILAGQHTMRLSLRKYSPLEKEVALEPGKVWTFVAKLEKNTGVIQFVTSPPDAQVFVDQHLEATSKPDRQRPDVSDNVVLTDVPAGEVVLEIVKPKYETHRERVAVGKDQTVNLGVINLYQLDDTIVILRGNVQRKGVITNRFPDGSFELRMRGGQGYISTTIKPDEVLEIRPISIP
jgi:hypothetical protein